MTLFLRSLPRFAITKLACARSIIKYGVFTIAGIVGDFGLGSEPPRRNSKEDRGERRPLMTHQEFFIYCQICQINGRLFHRVGVELSG
jgi:hypothetical protein